jgi:flagellar hook-associated protein 3 FlgL
MSTAQIYHQGIQAIQEQQSKVSKTSLQVASGKRIQSPSDDPIAAVQSVALSTVKKTAEQYQKNITLSRAKLNLEESTLQQIGDNLQRVREVALQGNNDTLSIEDRSFLATELRQRLAEIVDLTNTRDANGEYIFAGNRSLSQPFVSSEGGEFSYYGDESQRLVQISASRQVSINDPGSDVFMQVPQGNGSFVAMDGANNTGTGVIDPGSVTDPTLWDSDTYTITFTTADSYEVRDSVGTLVSSGDFVSGDTIAFSGIQTKIDGTPAVGDRFIILPAGSQDIFSLYQGLIAALESPGTDAVGGAKFHNAVNRAMVGLDQAMGGMLNTRSSVGARLQSLDNESEFNDHTVLSLEEAISTIEDLDYAEAISRLQLQLTGLQAAQQSYMKLQEFSLFDFLR